MLAKYWKILPLKKQEIDFDNVFVLKNYLDLFIYNENNIEISYDTLFNQNLEKEIINKDIIIFDKRKWLYFKNCEIINYKIYGNFISYHIRSINKYLNIEDEHLIRKIKIFYLMNK